MSEFKKKTKSRNRRAYRVRAHLKQVSQLPRVSVFRSLNHIYAQIIDGSVTKASCSTLSINNASGDKKERAYQVGLELAKEANKQGLVRLSFDRGCYLFHGRVAELARGLRDGGL